MLFAIHPRHLWKLELALLTASLVAWAIGARELALMFGSAAVTLLTVGERRDGGEDRAPGPELPKARARTRTPPRGVDVSARARGDASRLEERPLEESRGAGEARRVDLPLKPPGDGE